MLNDLLDIFMFESYSSFIILLALLAPKDF
jgi:hypothetical protein